MFSFDGAEQTLDSLDLYFSGQVGIGIVGFAHDFTPEFEATGRIIIEASDGETLEVHDSQRGYVGLLYLDSD